jgi:hypothetical protein
MSSLVARSMKMFVCDDLVRIKKSGLSDSLFYRID